jgi:DNA-directed RNA polymerase subunit RPC12/RpoP
MKRDLIIVLGAGVVAVAATVYYLQPHKPDPGKEDYKFMHCERCGTEFPYNKDQTTEMQCPRCAPKLSVMVPTKESVKTAGTHNPYTRMFMMIYGELVVIMIAVLYVTRRRSGEEDVDYLFMRCRNCQQKLRYREQQVGQFGKCPRCKRPIIFPAESLSIDE